MSVSKKKTAPQADKKAEKVYKTEELLKSKKITDNYQRDFAKVILTKPAYSLSEALAELDKVLKGGR